MQKVILKILTFIKLCISTFFSVFKILIFSKRSKDFNKLKVNTRELIILGNGPGLKIVLEEKQEFFINNELLCVNYFAESQWYEKLKPRFYVIIDRILYSDNYDIEIKEKNLAFFNRIAENTSREMMLFIPHEAKTFPDWQNTLKKNKNIKIIYINLTPAEGFNCFKNYVFNRNLGMLRPHNVLIPSVYIALKLNIKKILLFGTEHSWLKDIYVDENNRVMIRDKHFYEDKEKHREFFYNTKKGKRKVKYHEALYTFMVAFRGYYKLKKYAEHKKAEIINCTPGSFIDAFEKREI